MSPTQTFVDGEGLGVGSDDELLLEAEVPPADRSPRVVPEGGTATPIEFATFQQVITPSFQQVMTQMQSNNVQAMAEMSAFKAKFRKTAAEQQTALDSMDKRVTTGFEIQKQEIAILTRRLAALEERDPISATPPGRPAAAPAAAAAAAVAPAVATPDPWYAFNFEKGLRVGNYQHLLKKQDSSFSSSSNNTKEFTLRFGHIQGWATFNDDTTGITQDAVKVLAEKIKILLHQGSHLLVTDVSVGRLLNSRISLRISDGGEQCWIVKRKIDEALALAPLTIRGHRVYAMVESLPAVCHV